MLANVERAMIRWSNIVATVARCFKSRATASICMSSVILWSRLLASSWIPVFFGLDDGMSRWYGQILSCIHCRRVMILPEKTGMTLVAFGSA